MLKLKSSKNHIFEFFQILSLQPAQDLLGNLGNNKDPYQMHLL